MGEFAVPQREVEVLILLQDGRELSGVTYVPAIGPDGEPGHLIDRLNQEPEFLVLREGRNTHLIHETRILTVRILADEVEDRVERQIEESAVKRRVLVKIHLVSGVEIIAKLSYVQPLDHERLQDYLNTRRHFIPVRVQERLLYVNRRQIISVVALRGE